MGQGGGIRQADFVVVGSGVAGMRAAIDLAAAWRHVLLLTKDAPSESNTEQAQGGVAVVLSEEDRIGLHFDDTLRAGAGLSERDAAHALVEEGPPCILQLMEWGAQFDREGIDLAFTREAAHSTRRILHAEGDATGREIVRVLLDEASTFPNLTVVPRCSAGDLWVEEGVCRGLWYVDGATRRVVQVAARAVLLATGGAGRVFRENTNPPQATGDGMAMAYRAGAELMDVEFVQFHPTTLRLPGAPRWLLTEALRGEGGVLRDLRGRRFMPDYHPDAELAPRDVVSRSIALELRNSGDDHVLLDLTHLDPEFLRHRFPGINTVCRAHGLDFTRDPLPVHPAAHYFMGGVRTDLWGRTGVPGLYAAGEVACTGLHGANRLASNSLLEGLVFGARAADAMLRDPDRKSGGAEPGPPALDAFPRELAEEAAGRVADLAWEKLGVIREEQGLQEASRELDELGRRAVSGEVSRVGIEARNRWVVARAIARAAEWRRESRGGHFRSDYPEPDDQRYRFHSVVRPGGEVIPIPVGKGPRPVPEGDQAPGTAGGNRTVSGSE